MKEITDNNLIEVHGGFPSGNGNGGKKADSADNSRNPSNRKAWGCMMDIQRSAAVQGSAAAALGGVIGTATGPGSIATATIGGLTGSILGAVGAAKSVKCSDTVMCTYFHQKGMLSHQLWHISSLHANRKIHPATFRGYQVYGIPYVKLMRRSRLAEKLAFPLLLWRTEEVAYQMGLRKKGNRKGKLVRALTEPVWFITGLMIKEQDWESLWCENSAAV